MSVELNSELLDTLSAWGWDNVYIVLSYVLGIFYTRWAMHELIVGAKKERCERIRNGESYFQASENVAFLATMAGLMWVASPITLPTWGVWLFTGYERKKTKS